MARLDETASIDQAHAYRIHRLSRLLRQHLLRTLERGLPGISPEQLFILFRLHERDGRPQKELVDRTLNDRPNITRLVGSLEQKGLVERRPDPDDGRGVLVFFSEEGRAAFDALRPSIIQARHELFGGLAKDELAALDRTLDHLEEVVERLLR